MNELKIIPIPILPMGMVNAFLLISHESLALFDSGIPNSESKIGKVLKQHGFAFKDIDLIIISHAHTDHAGSASQLQKLCQAPVLAHEADLPYFLREKPMTYCTTGWFGRFFLKTKIPLVPYEAFTPDILLKGDDVYDLNKHGVSGTVFLTSGHTEGSISVALSDRRALASDLVSSGIGLGGIAFRNKPKPPPFEDNARVVAEDLKKLLNQGMETFYLGHGGPLTSKAVKQYADKILQSEET